MNPFARYTFPKIVLLIITVTLAVCFFIRVFRRESVDDLLQPIIFIMGACTKVLFDVTERRKKEVTHGEEEGS